MQFSSLRASPKIKKKKNAIFYKLLRMELNIKHIKKTSGTLQHIIGRCGESY